MSRGLGDVYKRQVIELRVASFFSRVPFCVLVSGNRRLLDRCLGMEMRCFEEKPYTFLFSKGYGKGIIK